MVEDIYTVEVGVTAFRANVVLLPTHTNTSKMDSYPFPSQMNGKNVVLMIFDTLRADLVYNEDSIANIPHIDSLLEKGVEFESAYSTAPETASSHATIFTGLYPHNHGVACDTPQPNLRKDIPVISSWLSERGYDTFGIAGPAKMGSDYNYDRGFDKYFEEYTTSGDLMSINKIKKLVFNKQFRKRNFELVKYGSDNGARLKLDKLRDSISNNLSTPYFVMANFTECHSDYSAPRPYMEEKDPDFSRPSYYLLEWLEKKFGRNAVNHNQSDTRIDRLTNYRESINRYYASPDYLNEAEITTWKKWYAAELQYLDQKLGEFIDFLQNNGKLEDTVFILTADHGELFGEHDLVYHNNFLWDKLLHVPLIISGNINMDNYKDNIISLADIFPTICDLVDIEKPDKIDGQSILSDLSREYAVAEIGQRDISIINRDQYLTEKQKHLFDRGKKAVWDDKFKYIRYSDGEKVIYNMPDETEAENVFEEEVIDYKEYIDKELGTSFPTPPTDNQEVSDSTYENLKRLGYR
jgi:arylsulfatase A-like enzyme